MKSPIPTAIDCLSGIGTGAVDRKINIRIDVFFVQYNKNSGYQFGVTWLVNIAGSGS